MIYPEQARQRLTVSLSNSRSPKTNNDFASIPDESDENQIWKTLEMRHGWLKQKNFDRLGEIFQEKLESTSNGNPAKNNLFQLRQIVKVSKDKAWNGLQDGKDGQIMGKAGIHEQSKPSHKDR